MNVVSSLPRIVRSVNHAAHRVVIKGDGVRTIWNIFRNDPAAATRLVVATLQHRAKMLPGRSQDAFPLVAVEPRNQPARPASPPSSFVLVFTSAVYADMLLERRRTSSPRNCHKTTHYQALPSSEPLSNWKPS
jgi:hypothetical protein